MSKSISIQLHSNQLRKELQAEMWRVYRPYYHYSEDDFYNRISNNTHYALYWQAGELVGFTGLRIQAITVDNVDAAMSKRSKRYFTIYFGQTVVTESVRACGLINRTGIMLLKKYWKNLLTHQTVFWADALSYRAYLVFAKNLLSFYPNVKEKLPTTIQQLRDKLGQKYYADRFCPLTGTVRKDEYLIRDPRVMITAAKLSDPDVSFYAQANPKYQEGYGLLTMGPANWTNIVYMLGKAIRKSFEMKMNQYQPAPQAAHA